MNNEKNQELQESLRLEILECLVSGEQYEYKYMTDYSEIPVKADNSISLGIYYLTPEEMQRFIYEYNYQSVLLSKLADRIATHEAEAFDDEEFERELKIIDAGL